MIYTDRVLTKPSDNYVVRYVLVINSAGVMSVTWNDTFIFDVDVTVRRLDSVFLHISFHLLPMLIHNPAF